MNLRSMKIPCIGVLLFNVSLIISISAVDAGLTPLSSNQLLETPISNQIALNSQQIANERDSLRREVADLQSKNNVLNIKDELQQSSNSRLEILIGLFGVLITILVIAFGFRTAQAAAQAARAEVSLYRSELDAIIRDSQSAGERAKSASEAAQRAADSAAEAAQSASEQVVTIAAHAEKANEHMAALRESAKAFSQDAVASTESIPDAATNAETDRGVSEAKLSLLSAHDEENWKSVIDQADKILSLESISDDDIAFATFFKASALSSIGDNHAEIRVHSEIIDRYSAAGTVRAKQWVANALLQRALTYGVLGDVPSEEKDHDLLIAYFAGSDDAELRTKVGQAYFWKAVNAAQTGVVRAPIAYLRKWNEYAGTFDCERVRSNLFSPVMEKRSFRTFLTEMGCVPEVA